MTELNLDRRSLERYAGRRPSRLRKTLDGAGFLLLMAGHTRATGFLQDPLGVLAAILFALFMIDNLVTSAIGPMARELLTLRSGGEQAAADPQD